MNCNFYTHAGVFHADEVAAYYICKMAHPKIKLLRLEDTNTIPNDGIIADIGWKYDPNQLCFDHHQGFIQRKNGYPYASCGLVWKQYGLDIIGKLLPESSRHADAIAKRVDERLIQGIDAHDADSHYKASAKCSAGKVRIKTISNIVSAYNADDIHKPEVQNDRFLQAAEVFGMALKAEIKAAAEYFKSVDIFEEIADFYLGGKVIVLEEHLPWKEIVHNSHRDVRFAILPSSHPGSERALIARPVGPDSREPIQTIERPDWFSGFIHQGKWIAGCNSVDEALGLAKYNLDL
jgi:uncharacterized UPF0160 family protein